MADTSRHASDMATHPDVAEMRERYERVMNGRRAVAVDGVIVLAGLYLAISAWVVHVNGVSPSITVTNLVLGLAMALLGAGLTLAPTQAGRLAWTCVPVAAFTVIAPWVVTAGNSGTRPMIWNNAFAGGVLLLCGLMSVGTIAAASRSRRTR